jgi:hypothetical protein
MKHDQQKQNTLYTRTGLRAGIKDGCDACINGVQFCTSQGGTYAYTKPCGNNSVLDAITGG